MRSSIRNPMIVAQFHGDNDESKIKEITFILSHWAVTGGFESRASRMLGACLTEQKDVCLLDYIKILYKA